MQHNSEAPSYRSQGQTLKCSSSSVGPWSRETALQYGRLSRTIRRVSLVFLNGWWSCRLDKAVLMIWCFSALQQMRRGQCVWALQTLLWVLKQHTNIYTVSNDLFTSCAVLQTNCVSVRRHWQCINVQTCTLGLIPKVWKWGEGVLLLSSYSFFWGGGSRSGGEGRSAGQGEVFIQYRNLHKCELRIIWKGKRKKWREALGDGVQVVTLTSVGAYRTLFCCSKGKTMKTWWAIFYSRTNEAG